MSYLVTAVIDGDTIEVSPHWSWNNETGNRVRIANLDAPEMDDEGGPQAKQKLLNLLLRKSVELKNPVTLSYGRLVCDVYLAGVDIKELI